MSKTKAALKASKKNACTGVGRGRPKGSTVREDIIESAGLAFVKHGYHACTVAHILEETGVSRTNFYRFFKNKEEVFEAIFLNSLENLAQGMQQARETLPKKMDARDKIVYLLDKYLRACFSMEALLPVIIEESNSLPRYRVIKEDVLKLFFNNISKTIVAGGHPKPDALRVEGFMAAVDRIVLLEAQKKLSSQRKINQCKKSILPFAEVLIQ